MEGAAPTTEAQPPTGINKSPAGAGELKSYTESQCWQCGEVGHLKKGCPLLKGKGLLQGGMLEQPYLTKSFPYYF